MAQAARLHLRMQKEIKSLHDDPPHGVSLNEIDLSSLSTIEARIKGPEGTVYANGVFILKIQIPERYPFQPPNVTFVTPIYHPNIDNGGRICLDILNLPPKGAWKPSLNIATVLISIGLLLSEPNPDDGLMAEISREYKYNRQVFDINAQLWTEKYASPSAVGASCWGFVDAGVLAQNTQMENTESQGSLPNSSRKDCEGNQRKMRSLGQKLSLKSERSEENMKTVEQDPVGSHLPSMAGSTYPTAFPDVSGRQDDMSDNMSVRVASVVVSKKEYQGNNKNLQSPGQGLSVASDAPSKRSDGNDVLPNHLPTSASDANDHAMQSFDDILQNSLPRSIGGSSDSSYKLPEGNRRNIRTLGIKLSLGQKLSLKSERSEENMKTVKQDRVGSHLPSMAGTTYPTSSFPDISVRQDDMSQNMSVGTASVVASKKEYKGNNKNLQLPDPGHSVASEAPSKRKNGNDVLPNHLPTSASDANEHAMQSSDDVLENSLPRSIGGSSDSSYKLQEGNQRNSRTLGMKLSLKSIKPEKKSDDDQKENMAPSHLPPQQGFNKLQKRPLDAVSRKQFSGGPALVQQNPITERQHSNTQVVSNEESNQGRKKLCSLSRRLALKSEQPVVDSACEEYKPPNSSISTKKPNKLPLSALPAPIPKGESVAPNELPLTVPAVLKSQAKALGFAGGQKDAKSGSSSVNENVVAMEDIVVSDSEDSEEEREKPPRSRLALMRRRLAGKLRT